MQLPRVSSDNNPYTPFHAATQFFAGRASLVEAFRVRIASDFDSSQVLVVGDPGIGKTSLLLQFTSIARETGSDPLVFDCRDYVDDLGGLIGDINSALPDQKDLPEKARKWFGLPEKAGISDFLKEATASLINRISINLPGVSVALAASNQTSADPGSLVGRMRQVAAKLLAAAVNTKVNFYLFLDHLDEMTTSRQSVLFANLFLAAIERSAAFGLSRFVFVGSMRSEARGRLEHLCGRPLFKDEHFKLWNLYEFNELEAIEAVRLPLQANRRQFSQELTRLLINLVSPLHPYYLQLASWAVFRQLTEAEGSTTRRMLHADGNEVRAIVSSLQHRVFLRFSDEEREILKRLAECFPRSQTSLQISEYFVLNGRLSLSQVTEKRLEELVNDQSRVVTRLPQGRFRMTHQLFAHHILDQECLPEETAANVLQTLLDSAGSAYQFGAVLMEPRLLSSVLAYRNRLQFGDDSIRVTLLSILRLPTDELRVYESLLEFWGDRASNVLEDLARLFRQGDLATLTGKELAELSEDFLSLVEWTNSASAAAAARILLKADDSAVVVEAVRVVGALSDQDSVSELRKLATHQDADVRRATAQALGSIGTVEAQLDLVSLLKDEDSSVSSAAFMAIVECGGTGVRGQLTELSRRGNAAVRGYCTAIIAKVFADDSGVSMVRMRLKDSDPNVVVVAARALGDLGDDSDIEMLAHLVKSRRPSVATAIIEILAGLREEATTPTLLNRLKSKDRLVRQAAFSALQRNMSENRAKAVERWMRTQPWRLRLLSSVLLSNSATYAETALRRVLAKDKNPFVRQRCAVLLGSRLGNRSTPFLLNGLSDTSPLVRKACLAFLLHSSDGRARNEAIQRVQNDPSAVVRRMLAAQIIDSAGRPVRAIGVERLEPTHKLDAFPAALSAVFVGMPVGEDRKAIAAWWRATLRTPDSDVRYLAASAGSEWGSLPELSSTLLASDDLSLRILGARLLDQKPFMSEKELTKECRIDLLHKLAKDSSWAVRREALKALWNDSDSTAASIIEKGLLVDTEDHRRMTSLDIAYVLRKSPRSRSLDYHARERREQMEDAQMQLRGPCSRCRENFPTVSYVLFKPGLNMLCGKCAIDAEFAFENSTNAEYQGSPCQCCGSDVPLGQAVLVDNTRVCSTCAGWAVNELGWSSDPQLTMPPDGVEAALKSNHPFRIVAGLLGLSRASLAPSDEITLHAIEAMGFGDDSPICSAVRRRAHEVLEALGARNLSAYPRAAGDERSWVRCNVALLAGAMLEYQEARAIIRRLSSDRDHNVRLWVVKALAGRRKAQLARPFLDRLAADDNESVSQEAKKLLEENANEAS